MPGTLLSKKQLLNEENSDKTKHALYLKLALFAFLGFGLSQLNSIGNLSPFSVSFVAGLPFDFCFSAFIGSSIGYFISHPIKEAIRYFFALLICSVFRLTVKRKYDTSDKPFVCAVVSFSSLLCSGIAYLAFDSFTFEGILYVISESLISLFGTLLFMKALQIPVLNIGLKKLSAQETMILVLNACILFMCMSGLTVGSISPARIIASLLIIFAAQYKGISLSSVVSICAGLSLSLGKSLHFIFPSFVLGGLVSGIFSSFGQYTTAFCFSVVSSLVSVICSFNNLSLFPVIEAVIAGVSYAVIPSKFINSLQDKIEESGLISDERVEREICANLERAAEKIGEVSKVVKKVSEKLDKVINPEINRIFAKMQQSVCYGCTQKSECWNKLFNETAADIMTIAGITNEKGTKTALEKRCIRPNALIKEIDNFYDDFVNGISSKIKISEMRGIVSDQFSSVSQFLGEIAKQMRDSRVVDKAKSRSIKSALEDSEIVCDSLSYLTNSSGGISIEATFEFDISMIDRKKMKKVIELLTGKKLEREEVAITGDYTQITFEEKAHFKVQFGHAQIPLAKNKVCGDCIARAYDLNSGEYALISDGMGTGSRAAIDATMTATLFEKLLSCGFSFESAFKMVNSALLVKSTDESLATVDAICINIFTGQADFYKAGAAVSFIRHKNAITVIEEASMPIGIIRDVKPARCFTALEKGDIILLASDGVTTGDCGWINDELLAWTTNNMNDLASHIASLAKLRSDKSTADDISVVAIKIH